MRIQIFLQATWLYVILLLPHQAQGIKCYACTNVPGLDYLPWVPPYDPDCGSSDYHGDVIWEEDVSGYSCFIQNDGGYVIRELWPDTDHAHHDCEWPIEGATWCWCTGDFCNYDLCDWCSANSTVGI